MKGEYSVKFEIDEPTKADEGAYKFVIQNEKGETTSDSMEVTEIPVEKGKIFIKHVTINLHSFDSHTRVPSFYPVPPSIKEKPKVVKDDKKKTVVMECIVRSDSPPKVKVMKGSETIMEDKKHFAKVEQMKEVQYFPVAITR